MNKGFGTISDIPSLDKLKELLKIWMNLHDTGADRNAIHTDLMNAYGSLCLKLLIRALGCHRASFLGMAYVGLLRADSLLHQTYFDSKQILHSRFVSHNLLCDIPYFF